MGHTHNFQSSGWGCQILLWSWDSKSRLIGISQGDRYKRGVNSENQVWEGQNGAMRRRRALLTFTLHSTVGISFIGVNAYSMTFGHGWAKASMPRVIGELRENQSGHWDDSWEAKKSTSALPNRSQIWDTVWWFNIHSPGLSFCPDRKSAARFSIPGTWTALKDRNLYWDQGEDGAQACPGCATVNLPDGLCGTLLRCCPSWLWYDAPRGRGENTSKPGRQPWVPGNLCAKRGTLLSIPRLPVCLRRPLPSPLLMRPSWPYGDGESHQFLPRSEEKRVPAIVKGVESNRATPW